MATLITGGAGFIGYHLSERLLARGGTVIGKHRVGGRYYFAKETFADISAISNDLGYVPTTEISVGIPNFVNWYRNYHGL